MAPSTAPLTCNQANCDFTTRDATELATHQSKSSTDGTLWACAAYDCRQQFCTISALGNEYGTANGHIRNCAKYREWNATRKYGYKVNDKVVGVCLFRATQIADGTIDEAAAAYNERRGKRNSEDDEEDSDEDDDHAPKAASKPVTPRRQTKRPQGNGEVQQTTEENGSALREANDSAVGETEPTQSERQDLGAVPADQDEDEIVVASSSQPSQSRRGPKIRHSTRTQAEAEAIASQSYGCSVCTLEFATYNKAMAHTDMSNASRFECPACEEFIACEMKPLAKHMRQCTGTGEWMSKNGVLSVDWRQFTDREIVELASSHLKNQAGQAKAGPNALFAMVMPGETKETWAAKAAEAARREAKLAHPVMLKARR